MKQGIRTGLIGLALLVLAVSVGVAASNADPSASAGASGSVNDQYGSVSAGAQAQVGPIVVQGAATASYGGRGWRGGTVKHCQRGKTKGAKRKRCARVRRRLRLAHKARLARAMRHASAFRAVPGAGGAATIAGGGFVGASPQPGTPGAGAPSHSPLCTLPEGCASSAPIGVGGTSSRAIRLPSTGARSVARAAEAPAAAPAAQPLVQGTGRIAASDQGAIGLVMVAGGALAALALAATARRTLRRARVARDNRR